MTAKQKHFADQYFLHGNAHEAAIKAGYSLLKNVSVTLNRLINNPEISAYLQQLYAAGQKKFEVTPQMVINQLAKIAFSNPSDYYHTDGSTKKISELHPDALPAIDVYEVNDVFSGTGDKKQKIGQKVTLKLHNKMAALDKLARYFGIHQPENNSQVDDYEFLKYVDPNDLDLGRIPQPETE